MYVIINVVKLCLTKTNFRSDITSLLMYTYLLFEFKYILFILPIKVLISKIFIFMCLVNRISVTNRISLLAF